MERITGYCLVLVLVFIFVFSTHVHCQLSEGEGCFHQKSRSSGICKKLDDCVEAQIDLLEKDIPPQNCKYLSDNYYIVCCRNTEPLPSEAELEPRFLDARHMCREYAKSLYTTKIPFNAPGALPRNYSQCGFVYRPLIYGGELAKGKEFPHMALIGYDENTKEGDTQMKWACGGTLISDQWILTAAHCLTSFNYGDAKYIRLGELDYNDDKDDAKPEDFNIVQRLKHPKYAEKQYHDIGLIKIDKKVKFNAYIRPACLWPERDFKSERVIVTGWGSTNDIYMEPQSSHLQMVTLSLLQESLCKPFFPKGYRLEEGLKDDIQLCAGPRADEEKQSACHGDSGGPVQIYATDIECSYYIVGVVSFGKPCGLAKVPGVSSRVSAYLPWIEDNVWRS